MRTVFLFLPFGFLRVYRRRAQDGEHSGGMFSTLLSCIENATDATPGKNASVRNMVMLGVSPMLRATTGSYISLLAFTPGR